MSNDSMKSMDMHMSFYWGNDVTVLFSGWPESNSGMYVLALLFVLLLAAGIEVLSMLSAVEPGTRQIFVAFTHASVYFVRMCFAYMSYNIGIFIAAKLAILSGSSSSSFVLWLRTPSSGTSPNGIPSKI
ncbi:copper transporter 1-like [Durio zibethinus]|uniref:Copper transport protein n=1 Tax=Durio zibethinus TaxID=66656 RepID=A0A6P5YWP2_DURZI|nr:copper transporter 1-like [Durio zibethinus]